MSAIETGTEINRIVAYSADPWESALPVLRFIGPAQVSGIEVIQGNQGHEVDVQAVAAADVVVIQRDFPRFIEAYTHILQIARSQVKPVIYETDDLLFALPEGHVSKEDLSGVFFPIFQAIVQADLVTTSTAFLQNYLRPLNRTVLLPNLLDDRLWKLIPPKAPKSKEAPVIIGYMGGETHHADLVGVVPALERLLDRFGVKIALRFWGGKPPELLLAYSNVDWVPLNLLDYAEFARYFNEQKCDIFIAPLEDNLFNRAKSAIKFLEYSALGLPGVYSAVEPYSEVIEHGLNGYLVSDPDGWVACLSDLIERPELRFTMGVAAQETVRKGWLLSKNASMWKEAYRLACIEARKPDPAQRDRAAVISKVVHQVQKRQNQLEREIGRVSHELYLKIAEANAARNQLDDIHRSRSWRVVTALQTIRTRLLPKGSGQERFLKKMGILSHDSVNYPDNSQIEAGDQ